MNINWDEKWENNHWRSVYIKMRNDTMTHHCINDNYKKEPSACM